ncbi:MAG: hypothetical protein LBQ70_04430 [Prevotellaceae bacterium]|jgi:hypothetical protein|nr:hypothetical protein [Prevotellaceae bacterium]
MVKRTDWLAQGYEKRYDQATVTINYLTAENLDRMGIAGAANAWYYGEVVAKYNSFKFAFENWKNPAERTPAKSAALKAAEADFVKVYRQFYTGYLRNSPLVTDEDLVSMGLPKRPSGGRVPPQPPKTTVEATVDSSIPATISISYRDKDERGTAKPKGVHGVEVGWAILDSPPTDWSQLTNSVFDTRTPVKLVFSGEQRGKTLYFALRWENTRGEKGPWSDIHNAIVP